MKTAPPRQRRLTSKGLEVISKPLKPFASADIKIRRPPPVLSCLTTVLLENIAQTGVGILEREGYQAQQTLTHPKLMR